MTFTVPQAVDIGLNHFNNKNYSEAENIFLEVLRVDPNNFDANHLLGITLKALRKYDEAVEFILRAIEIYDKYEVAYYNLALTYQELGQFNKAVDAYKKAIELNSNYVDAYNNLANLHLLQDDNLGAKETLNAALSINQKSEILYCTLGNLYYRSGELKQAADNYMKSIGINQEYIPAYENLVSVYINMKSYDNALDLITKAIEIDPDNFRAHNSMANILCGLEKYERAEKAYLRAISINPNFFEAYVNLGAMYIVTEDITKALHFFNEALKFDENKYEIYHNIGYSYQILGDFENAVKNYNKAISVNKNSAKTYRQLFSAIKFKEQDDLLKSVQELFKNSSSDEEKMHYSFALAKAYEDIGSYAKAFEFLKLGNDLQRSSFDYDINDERRYFELIKNIYNIDFLKKKNDVGFRDDTPVFIVGMPRSGSTLVEQILSSHSKIHGAGELNYIRNILNKEQKNHKERYPYFIEDLDDKIFFDIGKDYIDKIKKLSKKKYIIDKMPNNFLYIGLIKTVLPNAKIVHVKRNLVDTCLSIYKQYFTAKDSHKYAYDLEELGTYYNLYEDLMEHWKSIFDDIYEVEYEKLIKDQEEQSVKLIEYLALSWEESCKEFYKNKRKVSTASSSQVRKPLYKNSVNLWKNYEKELAPFVKKFIDF